MRDKLENFINEHLNDFDTKEPNIKLWSLIEKQLDVACDGNPESLEQFIIENKEQFNKKLPSSDVWSKIDQQLSPKSKVRKINFLRLTGIAASIVFLMLASAVAGVYFYGEKNESIATIDSKEVIKDMPIEFLELEKMYKKRVNRKHVQLANYNNETKAALSTVNKDLSQVDEIIEELKVELLNAPKGSEEQIINAMARNYETKLKILEIVLKRIRLKESKNEDEDEGISM